MSLHLTIAQWQVATCVSIYRTVEQLFCIPFEFRFTYFYCSKKRNRKKIDPEIMELINVTLIEMKKYKNKIKSISGREKKI